MMAEPRRRGRGKGQPKQVWQEVVLSYWCPVCDSGPGRWCLTSTGHEKPEPHAARVEVVARCPRCAAWIGADWPDEYCPRCAVLMRRHG